MQNIFPNRNHRQTTADAVQEVFDEYCSNCTVHGVRYMTDRSRHWIDRSWWILAFGLSVFFCAYSIQTMFHKWNENPVLIGFPEKDETIASISFPKITICPETKANKDKFDIFGAYHALKGNVLLTEKEQSQMEALHHICKFFEMDSFKRGTKYTNESIYKIIQDLAPDLDNTMKKCFWQSMSYNASEMFRTILTAEGVCFEFNGVNSRDMYTDEMAPDMMTVNTNPNISNWSKEMGYGSEVHSNDYPIRVFNAMQESALKIFPRIFDKSVEYLCRGDSQGFKVTLTPPGETIDVSQRSVHVQLLDQVDILIRPTLTLSEESLRKYTPAQRYCFYASERKLRFYKLYAQSNCKKECLSNFTLIQCGCVKFSMPRTKTTKICGVGSIDCYKNAEQKLYGEDVIIGLTDQDARAFRAVCNCLPACSTVFYDAEVDRSKFDWDAVLSSYKTPNASSEGWKLSKVMIRFKGHKVKTLMRSERFTITHFMSIFGGLLGLFLGISALSIVEFVYYATLRVFWAIRARNARNVVVPNNLRIINNIPVDNIDWKK